MELSDDEILGRRRVRDAGGGAAARWEEALMGLLGSAGLSCCDLRIRLATNEDVLLPCGLDATCIFRIPCPWHF